MLSSSLLKNASFLNRCLNVTAAPTRGFSSVAFNVKSKFEAAYQSRMAKQGTVVHKEYGRISSSLFIDVRLRTKPSTVKATINST